MMQSETITVESLLEIACDLGYHDAIAGRYKNPYYDKDMRYEYECGHEYGRALKESEYEGWEDDYTELD